MGTVSRPTDAQLARLAGRRRVLRIDQLLTAGLTPEAIEHRVRQGRLRRLWRGVYLVGPDPADPLSLAYGATASFDGLTYVDHLWGCFVHGFAPAPELPVDVLVVSGSRARRDGIRTHRSGKLARHDVGHVDGIPVTSAARAILGAAESATLPQLEALIAEGHSKRKVTHAQLKDVASRAGRRRAAARLKAVLEDTSGGMTLSEAERILRRLLKQAGLPQPLTNYPIGRYRADFCWPELGLIVEFDSWGHHGHRQAFRGDRRRNSHLAAKGWSILPITDEMLRHQPYLVVALITEAITRRQAAA